MKEKSNRVIKKFTTLTEVALATTPLLQKGAVAISGGSTYAKLFSHWLDAGSNTIGAQFFPVDERLVPITDEASNWRVATEELFEPLNDTVSPGHFAGSLAQYSSVLQESFGKEMPRFDVIFLGVGDDGHTASLFPGGAYLNDRESILLETTSPKAPTERVSLAPAVFQVADKVVIIIEGEAKREIVQRLLAQDMQLPIVQIVEALEEVEIWINENILPEEYEGTL